MADKDLLRTPHHVGGGWWYEEKRGISVVIMSDRKILEISWRSLRAAIKRKDKK